MNLSPISALAVLPLLLSIAGCEETASPVYDDNDPAYLASLPATHALLIDPVCTNAVITTYGVSPDDIFGANHVTTASGAIVDVVRHSTSTKWICKVDSTGQLVSISDEVPL